jgi:hypothetical protein
MFIDRSQANNIMITIHKVSSGLTLAKG